jgi:hypothetical protein
LWSTGPNLVAIGFDLATNRLILCWSDFQAICFCVDSWFLDSSGLDLRQSIACYSHD